MSDNGSQATQPNESDFHDSHPLDNDLNEKPTPAIGDLSTVESSIDTPHSDNQSVGDITSIEDSSKSEILGDISLLDEAFAEMGEDNVPQNNTRIPVLNESIDTPSESRIISPSTESASIPLLEQEATVFAEMLKPATNSTPVSTHTSHIPEDPSQTLESSPEQENSPEQEKNPEQIESTVEDDKQESEINSTPLFDSPDAISNTNISEMNSSLEIAAELLSETTPSAIKPDTPKTTAETLSQITGDAALAALLDDDTTDPGLGIPQTNTSSIDEKIASAHSEIAVESEITKESKITTKSETTVAQDESQTVQENSQIHINETPISAIETDESSHSEFSASFAENLHSSPLEIETVETDILATKPSEFSGTDISEFNPDVDLNSANVAQASHSVGILSQGQVDEESANNLNLSIPFELHSQLSSKIDELVIQATSSITEELHLQLSTQLDSLLANAVESSLPKLVNQMATELRNDINGRIKQQLPNIINDVLNKTRLQK